MRDFNYHIYRGNKFVAAFKGLAEAVHFVETRYKDETSRAINLVDGYTGEVLDIWLRGVWDIDHF